MVGVSACEMQAKPIETSQLRAHTMAHTRVRTYRLDQSHSYSRQCLQHCNTLYQTRLHKQSMTYIVRAAAQERWACCSNANKLLYKTCMAMPHFQRLWLRNCLTSVWSSKRYSHQTKLQSIAQSMRQSHSSTCGQRLSSHRRRRAPCPQSPSTCPRC